MNNQYNKIFNNKGSATIEIAIIFPVVLFTFILIFNLTIVIHRKILIDIAAREACVLISQECNHSYKKDTEFYIKNKIEWYYKKKSIGQIPEINIEISNNNKLFMNEIVVSIHAEYTLYFIEYFYKDIAYSENAISAIYIDNSMNLVRNTDLIYDLNKRYGLLEMMNKILYGE